MYSIVLQSLVLLNLGNTINIHLTKPVIKTCVNQEIVNQ